MSIRAKGQVSVEKNEQGERMLTLTPKSAEIPQIKITGKDGKEIELEQMLIQTGFNHKVEELMNDASPIQINMKNMPSPAEAECLGFKLQDLNVNFKKGFVEISTGYSEVDKPSK